MGPLAPGFGSNAPSLFQRDGDQLSLGRAAGVVERDNHHALSRRNGKLA
jgi:hypothetical protein